MLRLNHNWALEEELLLVNPAARQEPAVAAPEDAPRVSMEEIASTVIKARGLQVHAAGVLAGFSGLLGLPTTSRARRATSASLPAGRGSPAGSMDLTGSQRRRRRVSGAVSP